MRGRPTSTDRLGAIQSARAIAALIVVFVHAIDAARRLGGPGVGVFAAFPNLAVFGGSGVDLFFVISGFVMTHTLVHGGADHRSMHFFRRRITRIVPLFLLVSLAFLVLNPYDDVFAWQSIFYSATVLPVFDLSGYHAPALYVGWTLGFEFAFYTIVAAASARGGGRRAVPLLLGLTIIAGLAGLLYEPRWAPLRLLANPLQFEFALGVALWLAFDLGWLRGRGAVARLVGATMLLLGCAFGIALPLTSHYADAVAGSSGLARTLDWGLPWALILAGMLTAPIGATRLSGGLRRIGDASYSIYLVHPFAVALAWRAASSAWLTGTFIFIGAAMVASVLLGMAVHHWLEQPLLRAFAARQNHRSGAAGRCAVAAGVAERPASVPARSASTVRPAALTSAKPPSIAIVSGSPFSVR